VTSTRTPTPPSLLLVPGANFIGWTANDVSPHDALGNMGEVVDVVYSWNTGTRTWDRYGPNLPDYVNTLGQLKKGEAYWIIASGHGAIVLDR
jgi:hypothetical protein